MTIHLTPAKRKFSEAFGKSKLEIKAQEPKAKVQEIANSEINEKVLRKILKHSPVKIDPNYLSNQVTLSLCNLKELQQQESFPVYEKGEVFNLIATSKDEGYIQTTKKPMHSGSYKDFYKLIQISPQKVKAKAGLVIQNMEEFKDNGLRIDPLDFISENVLPKSDAIIPLEKKTMCIQPLYDGNLSAVAIKERWNFVKKVKACTQALRSLKDFHDNNYIHRDVKLENIFVKIKRKEEEIKVILGDEDSAIKINEAKTAKPFGTLEYCSPEALRNPSFASDMYAFGVTLEKFFPLVEDNRSLYLKHHEIKLLELMKKLKKNEPAERPTATEAIMALNSIILTAESEKDKIERAWSKPVQQSSGRANFSSQPAQKESKEEIPALGLDNKISIDK